MTGRRKPVQNQKPRKNLQNAAKNNFYCKKINSYKKNDKEPEYQKSLKVESLEIRNFRQKSNFIFHLRKKSKKTKFWK